MINANEYIKDVWHHEQDILNVVHQICIENGLKYSLIFGTLLGAVRHNGFIPWDDDIDILMPRDDYEKLLLIWNSVAPKGYILQNKRISPDFTQNFTKIRKDNTTFISSDFEKGKKYHKGIFIDIFPADRVAPKGFKRKKQYLACAFNLLCARDFPSGSKGIKGVAEKLILKLPLKTKLKIFNKTEKYISKWDNYPDYQWFSPNTINVCKRYFPSVLFDNLIYIEFNGSMYLCFKNYDEILKKIYGDYMKLPPKQDQVWKHHPIIISCEYNYEDIESQK